MRRDGVLTFDDIDDDAGCVGDESQRFTYVDLFAKDAPNRSGLFWLVRELVDSVVWHGCYRLLVFYGLGNQSDE